MRVLVALILSFSVGVAAGLIGVGGGEFRIPILLYVIRLPAIATIAVNFLIGFLTVVASLLRRLQLGLMDEGLIDIALAMSLSSIVGVYLGVLLTGKLPVRRLKGALATFLIIVGLRVGLEPFTHVPQPHFASDQLQRALTAVSVGVLIGVVSGLFGVAGGEFRIPALMYLFNLDVVIAGTVSLLVSAPTVATGFVKHHLMGNVDRNVTVIATIMGVGSVIGALIGASLAGAISKDAIKMSLSVILILTAVKMFTRP